MVITSAEFIFYLGIFSGIYFAIFTFITFIENKDDLYGKKNGFLPKVSIIVPCFNEEKGIAKTLDSIIGLNYPKDKIEILVVDDGSIDKTLEIAKRFSQEDSRIRVFSKKNGGKYTALNLGIRKAKYPFIATVDADSYLEKESLKNAVQVFGENKEVKAVISTIKISEPKNVLERVQYIEFLIIYFLRKIFSFADGLNVVPGPLSIFKREVFEKIGEYRAGHRGEDLEMAFRMQKHNLKIAHAVDSIVYTKACGTFSSLFRQRVRWKRSFILNLLDYKELLSLKKHGNLAFILIYTILGNMISVVLVGYGLWHIIYSIWQKLFNLSLVNFDFSFSFLPPHFISFFSNFNFGPTFLLGILSLMILLTYVFASKKITFDKSKVGKNTVLYLVFYSFLNTSWWLWAIFSTIFKKDVPWR